MRVCTDCGQVKPLSNFTSIKGTPYYHGRCKPCRAARVRAGRPARPTAPPLVRTCTDCGETKAIDEFLPIKACKVGCYGRCRACRANRARERYWADPSEREAQKARVRRNRLWRRMASAAPA